MTWKTISCSAFVTLCVVSAAAGEDALLVVPDGGLLAAVWVEHAAIDAARRTAELSAIALRPRRFKCSAMTKP
jgi:hypothetical protein